MKQTLQHLAWILLASTIVFFTNLGATRLWDQDESFFAATAAEMHDRGEWTVPYFNGELFSHKPPFMYWMMLIGYEMFGDNEFAVRFWSAIFGMATSLLIYFLGRRLFCAEIGLWAGLAMTTALMFDVVARAATADSYLVFFSALSLYLFVAGSQQHNPAGWAGLRQETASNGRHPLLPTAWWPYAASYAVMGLAVMVKGPIGVLLPTATIGLFLLCTAPGPKISDAATWTQKIGRTLSIFHPRLFFGTIWQMRPLTALAMVALVAGPWFYAVSQRTGGTFILEFLGVHNVGRFMNAMDGHSGPIFYYIPVILIGFFPWSIFGMQMIRDAVDRISGRDAWGTSSIFLLCWAGVFIGFFSLASTKLPNYVLTAYPALALLTACFLYRWIHRPQTVPTGWIRSALFTFTAVGVLLLTVCPILGFTRVGDESLFESLGVSPAVAQQLPAAGFYMGITPLLGGLLALYWASRKHPRAAVISLQVASVLFVTTVFAVVAVEADQHQTSQGIAQSIDKIHADGETTIAQYKYFRPSLTYYNRQPIATCRNPEQVAEFFAADAKAVLITTEAKLEKLQDVLPEGIEVLDSRPQFPEKGTVVVLGRRASQLAKQPAEATRRQ